jgi:hypothetical protein
MDKQLVRRQSGVLTRRQCAAAGVDRWHIRNQLAARRWQVAGGVVVLHNGPLTRTQQLWVAVLNHRAPSALAGVTACEWLGLKGCASPTIHVMSPFGARPLKLPGVVTHVTRDFSRVLANELPCARPARAVVQAASWEPDRRRACAIAVAAVQQGLVKVDRLAAELANFHGRHAGLLRGVTADIRGGADSMAEIDFVQLAPRRDPAARAAGGAARLAGSEEVPRRGFRLLRRGGRRRLPPARGELLGRHGQAERSRDRRRSSAEVSLVRDPCGPRHGGQAASPSVGRIRAGGVTDRKSILLVGPAVGGPAAGPRRPMLLAGTCGPAHSPANNPMGRLARPRHWAAGRAIGDPIVSRFVRPGALSG